jgi:GNAT superfamily N-acetyltransferase
MYNRCPVVAISSAAARVYGVRHTAMPSTAFVKGVCESAAGYPGHHVCMPITLRRADPDDWRTYRDIRLRALREEPRAYASTLERELRLTDQQWRDRLGRAFTVLALTDEELVGTATGVWQGDGDMMIVAMYVVPQARGRGLAVRLIDEIAEVAMAGGGRRLLLDLAEGNAAAERRYGFVLTGQSTPMERDPSIMESRFAYPLGDPSKTP